LGRNEGIGATDAVRVTGAAGGSERAAGRDETWRGPVRAEARCDGAGGAGGSIGIAFMPGRSE
jgi:hypothetical protein